MERPRLAGGTLTTFVPSIRICPALTSSSPAMRRYSVVLPHPDGPTKTTNDPSAMSRSAPLMTSVDPNALRTPSSVMRPMIVLPWLSCCGLLDGSEGEPGHELSLAEPAEHQDWCDRERRGGREL